MSHGLYLSAAGAQAQSQRLEVIANNLANVETVGFKRELAMFQARFADSVEQGNSQPGSRSGSRDEQSGMVHMQETKTDFSPGLLKRTGAATDLALENDGFFLVRKGNDNLLTRAGNFRMTSGGDLVTQQGYAVLGDSGAPIRVSPGAGPWEVSSSGAIRQGDTTESLAVVRPDSLADLVKTGENLFRTSARVQAVPAAERSVRSGYLELSGVQPTTEMVAMIETSRAAEANLNLIQAQNQMLSGLISRVLKA